MNKLVSLFKESIEVKRLKELRLYFSKNKELDEAYRELKRIQKLLVRAKVDNDMAKVKALSDAYNQIKSGIINLPFVEEYFELLENVYRDLKIVEEDIEKAFDEDFSL